MYNVRYTDHESNIASSCIMSDTQITSPSVSDIIHDDAMLDSWSVYLTLYMMTQCWTRDLCIWHYTWWRNVGLVICIWHYTWWRNVGLVTYVSDIIQNGSMLDSWSVYLTFTEWCHVGLMICVSDIIQNGFMLDSWSVYLTFTEWCHVGLVICVSDIVQNDAMLDSWSVHLTLYRMTPCWTRDLVASFCIMLDKQIISPTWHHSV